MMKDERITRPSGKTDFLNIKTIQPTLLYSDMMSV